MKVLLSGRIYWLLSLLPLFFATLSHAQMPLPVGTQVYSYASAEFPVIHVNPSQAKPIGVGPVANGQDTFRLQVQLSEFTGGVDIYFAIYCAALHPTEFFLFDDKGSLKPFSTNGYVKWRSDLSGSFNERPFPDLSVLILPPGTYFFYLLVSPAGSFASYFLWSTSFTIINTEPYIDVVVDNTVIDFGRLDGVRRNQGIGLGAGAPADHPIPFPNIFFSSTPTIPNWGVYQTPPVFPSPAVPPAPVTPLCPVPGTASPDLLRIPIMPAGLVTPPSGTPTNHFAPIQNPWGMTMVYAIVADADLHPINLRFILPEPIMGKGNLYTAIPIPNYPIGTLIDSYAVMSAYNAQLSLLANNGWLPIQPHLRNGVTAGFVSPIEPSGGGGCRETPWEFPYIIGFRTGSDPSGTGISPGDVVTEAPNPLGLTPKGTVLKVFVKEGDWIKGNASGYLWMIPVDNDFWDPRHSVQIPALYVGGAQKAICSFVGQALPVIWEAPDDPDAGGTTHDKRHMDPQAIPPGGTVNLEARVTDRTNAEWADSAPVAFPMLGGYKCEVDLIGLTVEYSHEDPNIPAAQYGDGISFRAMGTLGGSQFIGSIHEPSYSFCSEMDCSGYLKMELDTVSMTASEIDAYFRFGEAEVTLKAMTNGQSPIALDRIETGVIAGHFEGTATCQLIDFYARSRPAQGLGWSGGYVCGDFSYLNIYCREQ